MHGSVSSPCGSASSVHCSKDVALQRHWWVFNGMAVACPAPQHPSFLGLLLTQPHNTQICSSLLLNGFGPQNISCGWAQQWQHKEAGGLCCYQNGGQEGCCVAKPCLSRVRVQSWCPPCKRERKTCCCICAMGHCKAAHGQARVRPVSFSIPRSQTLPSSTQFFFFLFLFVFLSHVLLHCSMKTWRQQQCKAQPPAGAAILCGAQRPLRACARCCHRRRGN